MLYAGAVFKYVDALNFQKRCLCNISLYVFFFISEQNPFRYLSVNERIYSTDIKPFSNKRICI